MENIEFYDPKNAYGEFSNYFASSVTIDNVRYPTTEHYYQAQKFLGKGANDRSLEYAKTIIKQNTPNKAKILASQKVQGGYKWKVELNVIIRQYPDVKIREDWESIKDNVMRVAVLHKFIQHDKLKELLLKTGDLGIVEHSKDNYWGDGLNNSGLNMLGKILVETRELLRCKLVDGYWIIKNVLGFGDKCIATLNADLSLYVLDENVADADKFSLFTTAIGTKRSICLHGNYEQYSYFIPMILSALYHLDLELCKQIMSYMR